MTLSIPKELREKMKRLPEVKWSEVARRAIRERIEDFEEMERIVSKSKLTKKDSEKIAKKIKRSAAKKFYEYNNR